ncbi:MAG: hypothetical protein VKS61_13900 [Candidatus Sericytochromatia bacterium]|nr:hypothetical protein [Candidatus Sericytochromatia bacterium]
MPVRPHRLSVLFLAAALALGGCDAADLGAMLGVGDGATTTTEAPPPPPPRPQATPEPTPKPTPKNMAAQLVANLAFDKVRGRGIREVYEGQTKLARETFKAAQQMKPQDRSVPMWLDAIETAYELKRKETKAASGAGGAPGMPPIGPPLTGPPTPPVSGTPQPAPSFDPTLVF